MILLVSTTETLPRARSVLSLAATNVSSAAPKVSAAALQAAVVPTKSFHRRKGSGHSGAATVALEAAVEAAREAASASMVAVV